MSGTGETREDFAGEERAFRIRLGEIRRIEDKCKVGVGEVGRRLSVAFYIKYKRPEASIVELLGHGIQIYADDVREVIYQGLVGGGMSSGEATKLVRMEIDDRGMLGLIDNVGVALVALAGARSIPEGGEPAGEPKAGTK
jgi:hypothetical protein